MGMVGRPQMVEQRKVFWRLRQAGLPVQLAAKQAGCDFSVGHEWIRLAGGVPPRRRVERSSRYLTLDQRETIAEMLLQGFSRADIAKAIGVHASTVCREIRRNSPPRSDGKLKPCLLYTSRCV